MAMARYHKLFTAILVFFTSAFSNFMLTSPKAGDTLYIGDTVHIQYSFITEYDTTWAGSTIVSIDSVTAYNTIAGAEIFFSVTPAPRRAPLYPLFNNGAIGVPANHPMCGCWGDERIIIPDTTTFGALSDTVRISTVSNTAKFLVCNYPEDFTYMSATNGYLTIAKHSGAAIRPVLTEKSARTLSAAATARGLSVFVSRPVNSLRVEATEVDGRRVSVVRMTNLRTGVQEFSAASLGLGKGLFICRVFAGNETAAAVMLNVNSSSMGGK